MILNRRHKVILFICLVVTGIALLVGVEVKAALGTLLLGIALAWAIGSQTASNTYKKLKFTSSVVFQWVRLPLLTLVAGAILSFTLLVANANLIAAIAVMCFAGIAISPLRTIPSVKRWARTLIVVIATATFCGGLVFGFSFWPAENAFAFQAGKAAIPAAVAFVVGIFWLSRGARLIHQGISAADPIEVAPPDPAKKVRLRYISLVFGVLVLTLILSLLTFGEMSGWAYGLPETTNAPASNVLGGTVVLLLFCWWPYGAFKKILSREPNSNPQYVRRHRRVLSGVGMFFVVVMSLAVAFGVQNGNDRKLGNRAAQDTSDLAATLLKINLIKQRDLGTAADYVHAYAEVEPLLDTFDGDLQRCIDDQSAAVAMEQNRGPVNIQRLYSGHAAAMKSDADALEIFRELAQIIRKEVTTIQMLAVLPDREQASYWQSEFQPLLAREDAIRRRAASLEKK